MNNILKKVLCLSLALSVVFIFCLNSNAEKVSSLGQVSINDPSDGVIASDGSFFIVADTQSSGEVVLLKSDITFSGNDIFTNTTTIPLNLFPDGALTSVALSGDNKKAAVYIEPIGSLPAPVKIIDLFDNSSINLNSLVSNKIGPPVFLDKSGKKLVAATLEINPKLISIDTVTDEIQELASLPDTVQSLFVSPDFENIVITYQDFLAQSVSVFNIKARTLSTVALDQSLSFTVDDFLPQVDFDASGKNAVLSTLGGNHSAQLLDLENTEIRFASLDNSLDGLTLSTISPDGMTIISAGTVSDIFSGFQLYEASVSGKKIITATKTQTFNDDSTVLDLVITPDQSKILLLVLKDEGKKLKVVNKNTFKEITELAISEDSSDSSLLIESNGRFAITSNKNIDPSVDIINDFNLGPILKTIVPNRALANISLPFTINSFIDLSRFSPNVQVCFQNAMSCATSVNVSNGGQVITGSTPTSKRGRFADVLLIATPKGSTSSTAVTSTYNRLFEFIRQGGKVLVDTFPPEITILAPTEGSIFDTRRIIVLGKVDGTGSEVLSVTINGNPAALNTDGQRLSTIVDFVSDLEFESDGVFEVTVTAQDNAQNTNEKTVKITIDTLVPELSATIDTSGNIIGVANGTGSNISSILVNSVPITFPQGEVVNFTAISSSTPVTITAFDSARNQSSIEISSAQETDITPPVISISFPANGQIIKDNKSISITFSATDDTSIKEVKINGEILAISGTNQYSKNIDLNPGRNTIFITATDTSNNKSSSTISVTFITSDLITKKPEDISKKDKLNEKNYYTVR